MAENSRAASLSADPYQLHGHFTVLIYPFIHGVTDRNVSIKLENLRARWQPWWHRLDDAEARDVLEASEYFLPYVQKLLVPETARLNGQPCDSWLKTLRLALELPLGEYCRSLGPDSVLRLTLRRECLSPIERFVVMPKSFGSKSPAAQPIPAELRWVDAFLFPTGVGFFLLKLELEESARKLTEQHRLNRAMMPVTTDYAGTLHWPGATYGLRDLLDYLAQGFSSGEAPASPNFLELWKQPDSRTSYADSEYGRAFGRNTHQLSYACVHLSAEERAELAKGTFASGEDRLLFEFANGNLLGQTVENPVWAPSPAQAARYSREHVWSPWNCWRAMFLRESLAFLGVEDLWFTRKSLPRTIENDYLPLYVFSLFQKFQLYLYANDLMSEVASVNESLAGARSLMRRFIVFRNRYWFAEVTRKPQGGELYRLLHRNLEIDRLYDMVTASVKEAKEFYQEQWDRRVEMIVKGLGFVAGPLVASYGALRYAISDVNPEWGIFAFLSGAIVTSGALAWMGLALKDAPSPWKSVKRPTNSADGADGTHLADTTGPQRRKAA